MDPDCERCGGTHWVLDPNEEAHMVACHLCFPRRRVNSAPTPTKEDEDNG